MSQPATHSLPSASVLPICFIRAIDETHSHPWGLHGFDEEAAADIPFATDSGVAHMRFVRPRGMSFEIPDEWWAAAAMERFKAKGSAYRSKTDAQYQVISLTEIEPPTRLPGYPLFVRDRMIDILRGLAAGDALPPIELHSPPRPEVYKYAVRNGFHRFYASAAAGFEGVPAIVHPYFDIGTGLS